MANVEVSYDRVLQELQERQTNSEYLKLKLNSHIECRQTNSDEQKQTDMVKMMEDIQFNSALLRNGILAEATEFELARQYDDTLARKGYFDQTMILPIPIILTDVNAPCETVFG